MELKTIANEYAEDVKKMTEQFKKKFGEMVFDDDVDTDVLELMRNMFNLIDVSTQLVVAQSNAIQEINEKMDMLLVEKES